MLKRYKNFFLKNLNINYFYDKNNKILDETEIFYTYLIIYIWRNIY